MRVPKKIRYAVRLLIDLALQSEGSRKAISINKIAQNEEISSKFLSQIILYLKNYGLIKAERGAGGGYRLNKPPDEITIYDVFLALEGLPAFAECVEKPANCRRSSFCAAHELWAELSCSFSKRLKEINLAGLANRTKELSGKPAICYQI